VICVCGRPEHGKRCLCESVRQHCGLCVLTVGPSASQFDRDPACDEHRPWPCLICGGIVDDGTISHGGLGTGLHRPLKN
jgi:hypothetical protein